METIFKLYVLQSDSCDFLTVNIYKDDNDKKKYVNFDDEKTHLNELNKLYVKHLRDHVCSIKEVGDSDKSNLKLWKVSGVTIKDIKEQNISTKEDVQKLQGKDMELDQRFSTYFRDELDKLDGDEDYIPVNSIITIIPDGNPPLLIHVDTVDWSNIDSVYNWIKELKQPNENRKPKFVSSFGAEFPLQGRDETFQILNLTRNKIRQRLVYNDAIRYDNELHHIPILANGPGTGKSRFLQELLTLLEQYRNEHLSQIDNLKIKTLDFKQFMGMCGKNGKDWKTFEIETACGVVLKDVGGNIDFFVIGIDELNVLHNLAKGDQRPVRDIIHAVGSLSCITKKMLYVPILAGTIQGPLEKLIQESTYKLLRLPLHLLSNEEVNAISVYSINTHEELKNYINKNSRIVQCCISDLSGHVKALEYFYNLLLNLIKKYTHTVNYVFLMNLVKFELEEKYPFRGYAKIMEQVVVRAILNIPVNKDNPVNYVDLPSKEIQVLLKGAYHAVDCPHLNYEIQLPTVDLYYIILKSQFPDNVQIENLSPGIMYKNGKGAPCADHFFFLDDLLVFIQYKSLDATTTGQSGVMCNIFTSEKFYAHVTFHIDLLVISIESD
ncbi:hypothetical protein GLOIN_2v1483319 [Rhizophagus irregularis DAOM 181602=DAOM 197198]|uniref:Crinkler family protein n=2 Tax=Rhizophagus irregularis TaxID=588596 RepID=A0A2P4PIF2_RHIID|nr:hypothetical protein GLOIN_2v1483319 [Rhizophagus irregularis DAOM 181602=DAOM 197198]POG65148.1 hypothetical protein GLOIN_2v1483319 [Rhizophagus irregularis DAOM 181602=DAOM 197198]|eukprot:XP_025172014.1 hypothetical protein GLOIN_2v1483319 [Rhizophagus irregularis DAOM 181602=DAOM 197198]